MREYERGLPEDGYCPLKKRSRIKLSQLSHIETQIMDGNPFGQYQLVATERLEDLLNTENPRENPVETPTVLRVHRR